MSLYVAPEADEVMSRYLGSMTGMFGTSMLGVSTGVAMPYTDDLGDPGDPGDTAEPKPSTAAVFEDFAGAAATLRFNDGSLELEVAGDARASSTTLLSSDNGADRVGELPADTIAAIGVGLTEGWFGEVVDQLAASEGATPEEFVADLEAESGLDLPEDAQSLLSESLTASLGADFDAGRFFDGGLAELPFAVTVEGDPEEIESVLDKVRPQLGVDEFVIDSEPADGAVVIGPNPDYRSQVVAGGELADTDEFKAVVEDAEDASTVVFVNFDAGGWLDRLAEDDAEIADNLRPLAAAGIAAWRDGDVSHSILRITTD